MSRTYIFKRFERFWHWSQAALIIFMLLSGFEVHGSYKIFGWQQAANMHTTAAWALIVLWAFAIFWHFTTGEWKQYIPTTEKISAVMYYYAFGIFDPNAHHPFHTTELTKHNPLQRLAYLFVKLFISPLIWISGLLYLYYHDLGKVNLAGIQLGGIATAHTLAAFLMLLFLIVHVYFATTGHTPLAHIKAMITGWEDIKDESLAGKRS
ncbi:MAG: cytochrome b/b6 domain-containing protein [Georgfuchsia sp.]